MRAAVAAAILCLMPGPALAQNDPPTPPPGAGQGPIADDFVFIGTATMSADGTVTLDLETIDNGMSALGRLVYAPDDPQYDDVLRHIGAIRPGETKPVEPWPE